MKNGLRDFRIYPTIGNHDTYPQDVFRMSSPKGTTTINDWTPSWREFFDISPEKFSMFEKWGYYSLPLVDKQGRNLGNANTKIISLNNNFCYQFNWEVLTLYEDPGH